MFMHLDDPNPPTPGSALGARLRAEGGRRRRRRTRAMAGGALTAVIAVGAASVRWSDGDTGVVAGESDTTSSSEAPTTTESTSSSTTTTAEPDPPDAGGIPIVGGYDSLAGVDLRPIDTAEEFDALVDQLSEVLGPPDRRVDEEVEGWLCPHAAIWSNLKVTLAGVGVSWVESSLEAAGPRVPTVQTASGVALGDDIEEVERLGWQITRDGGGNYVARADDGTTASFGDGDTLIRLEGRPEICGSM